MSFQIQVEDWSLIEYQAAYTRQLQTVQEVLDGGPERVIFCAHPPVVTLGRGSKPEDLLGWSGPIVETNRGGRATYHGPNQLVIYPILNLSKTRDIARYLRNLEMMMIEGLKTFGLDCASKAVDEKVPEDRSFTGVWIENRKIASIGIAVKKWITYHGCALNLKPDPLAFTGINPCGFNTKVMTDLQTELGREIPRDKVKEALVQALPFLL